MGRNISRYNLMAAVVQATPTKINASAIPGHSASINHPFSDGGVKVIRRLPSHRIHDVFSQAQKSRDESIGNPKICADCGIYPQYPYQQITAAHRANSGGTVRGSGILLPMEQYTSA